MGSLYYKARAHTHVRTRVYEIKWKEPFWFAPKYSQIQPEFIWNSEPLFFRQIQNSIFRTEIQQMQHRNETELPNSAESSVTSSE